MTEENNEKPQLGWSAPGFEPGASRMRVSCVTTEPPRSVVFSLVFAFSQRNKTYKMGLGVCVCVCVSVQNFGPLNNFQTSYPIDTKFWLYTGYDSI